MLLVDNLEEKLKEKITSLPNKYFLLVFYDFKEVE